MLKISTLYSRLLFVFALVCAAVMSFIMRSDAARASPITTQVDKGVKHNVLRRLYIPYSQHHPLFIGLLSTETGLQRGTNSETETSSNYRKALSIIDHQSNPLQFTKGSFSYHQNIPDNKQAKAGISRVWSGVRPASSLETRQSRVNYHPLSQKVAQNGNSYNSVIIRKPSYKEATSLFYQSSSPSHIWEPKDAQKSYNREKVPRNDSPKMTKDETVWQPSDSSLFSSQTGTYWSTTLPTSRGHYSGYKETNELTAAGPWSTSTGIQSSKFLGFASQTAPHAPSISNRPDASVIKSNPSPEKLTSSITDFYHGPHSVRSSETPKHKKLMSYLFKDPQTSHGGHEAVNTVAGDGHRALSTTAHKQRPSNPQVYSRFSSNFKQLEQPQREEPTKGVQHQSDNANPLYQNTNAAQYGAQIDRAGTQISVYPAPPKDVTMESFVPVPHADFQSNYATGSDKSVVSSLVITTPRGSMQAHRPGVTTKSIYGLRGFKSPTWRAVKESPALSSSRSDERFNSQRFRFDKGKFKIANVYPSLSPKYSFGQRGASTATVKPERAPTDYSSPSPGTLDIIQTKTTPRPLTSGFKEARPPLPESDAGKGRDPDRTQFRNYRRIFGFKGFGNRPLEGAKPLVSEPDKSARVQQGFKSFKLRSWQPKSSRSHWWYNKTEPGSSRVSTKSQNEQSSEELKPLLKTAGSTVTRFTPDTYKKTHKINTQGFHPLNVHNKTHWRYKEQNASTASASHTTSSAYIRSAVDLEVKSSQKSEPSLSNKTKLPAMKARLLGSSTSSTVRGKRVNEKHTNGKKLNESTFLSNGNLAIVRLPKRPVRVKAVTYSDIVGSASFSGIRATTQTPTADYFPDATAAIKQKAGAGHWTLNSEDAVYSRGNTSRGPKAQKEGEEEYLSSVEENKRRSEEVDSDVKTSGLFLDDEGSGSGSGGFIVSSSTNTTKSQGLSEDLFELDYLRISTGNISFKSL
ncbi:uncharacterized protein LOC118337826 [Morone saxatilis]|uniref:uncharacterized protein LOC118337826 n=1 Tax=Morone saxatilis TaxID=34816 RepID=UPI0015E1E8ED|nr:uncharacterized protein LOC118337826 [Morone saxatilis]